MKGAWHGDPALKAEVVARMIEHREKDEIIQGVYQEQNWRNDSYRGCLIGCTLPYQESPASWHRRVEELYGIPYGLARMLDSYFERLDFDDAADFAVASIEAIPVGADLSGLASLHADYLNGGPALWRSWFMDEFLQRLQNAPLVVAE